jgi:hypothetical protein
VNPRSYIEEGGTIGVFWGNFVGCSPVDVIGGLSPKERTSGVSCSKETTADEGLPKITVSRDEVFP